MAVAVAGTLSSMEVPVMLTMLAPAGIPGPLTPMPTLNPAEEATVTKVEETLVSAPPRVTGAASVTLLLVLTRVAPLIAIAPT